VAAPAHHGSSLGALAVAAVALALPGGAQAATVTVSPARGAAGTDVLLQGADFGRSRVVAVTAGRRRLARVRADRRGVFRTGVRIPAGATGTVFLRSATSGRRARRVVNRFAVSSRRVSETTGELAASSGERLRWSMTPAAGGAAVELRGAGLGRSRSVSIVSLGATVARARTDRAGRLSARFAVGVRRGRASAQLRVAGRTLRFAGTVAADPVVAAAGDIACDPAEPNFNNGNGTATHCRQKYTSDAVLSINPTAVLVLGDLQYNGGEPSDYAVSYGPTWGRFRDIAYPVLGNHDPGRASGYFRFFGPRVGTPERPWYSFDLGAWHLVALNTNLYNCNEVTSVDCSLGGPQLEWLRADLAAHPNRCVLAFFHYPRFSSGTHGNYESVQPIWEALYAARADVVLSGHDHDYERFAPQDPTGRPDRNGPREFVVGTGGRDLRRFHELAANSEVRQNDTYGVLKLTLHASSYDWEFVPEAGRPFRDSGTGTCA
jgi:hypothetical protein